eukprot:PhF_6_TR42709/c0_g1_i1/m.64517
MFLLFISILFFPLRSWRKREKCLSVIFPHDDKVSERVKESSDFSELRTNLVKKKKKNIKKTRKTIARLFTVVCSLCAILTFLVLDGYKMQSKDDSTKPLFDISSPQPSITTPMFENETNKNHLVPPATFAIKAEKASPDGCILHRYIAPVPQAMPLYTHPLLQNRKFSQKKKRASSSSSSVHVNVCAYGMIPSVDRLLWLAPYLNTNVVQTSLQPHVYLSTWDMVMVERDKSRSDVFQGNIDVPTIHTRVTKLVEWNQNRLRIHGVSISSSHHGRKLCDHKFKGSRRVGCAITLIRRMCLQSMVVVSPTSRCPSHILLLRFNNVIGYKLSFAVPALRSPASLSSLVLSIGTKMSIMNDVLFLPYVNLRKTTIVTDAKHTRFSSALNISWMNDMVTLSTTDVMAEFLDGIWGWYALSESDGDKVLRDANGNELCSEIVHAKYAHKLRLTIRPINFLLTPYDTVVPHYHRIQMDRKDAAEREDDTMSNCNRWTVVFMKDDCPPYSTANGDVVFVKTKRNSVCNGHKCDCCLTHGECMLSLKYAVVSSSRSSLMAKHVFTPYSKEKGVE